LKAVLDLGTNTFHLLIAEQNGATISEVYQKQIPVKIGAGGINQGFISSAAYARGIAALEEFSATIKQYPVQSIVATGTSAIRHANNGATFLAEIAQKFGFTVQSINGETEASLIYKGVSLSFPFPDQPVLVMDIGGGSVEFIIGKKEEILWKQSFEIGAARLLDKFKPSNPISEEEIIAVEDYLNEALQPLSAELDRHKNTGKPVQILIGSAGSFETLLDVLSLDLNKEIKAISPFAKEVSLADAALFYQFIIGSNQSQREEMKGLLDFRVDMIVVATLLMRFAQNSFGIKQLIASHYALKEGLLFF